MDSQLNKAHKTKPMAQPDGVPSPASGSAGPGSTSGPDRYVLELHAQLCDLVEDASARSALLGVPESVDAAWAEGRMIPVLRARRKALERAVASFG